MESLGLLKFKGITYPCLYIIFLLLGWKQLRSMLEVTGQNVEGHRKILPGTLRWLTTQVQVSVSGSHLQCLQLEYWPIWPFCISGSPEPFGSFATESKKRIIIQFKLFINFINAYHVKSHSSFVFRLKIKHK